jgi:hypothetical protein
VVEFFDEPGKAAQIMEHLADAAKPGHMLSWTACINVSE